MSAPAPAWLCLLCNADGTTTEVVVGNAEFLSIRRLGVILESEGVGYVLDSFNKHERTAKFYQSVTPLKDLGNK